MHRYQVVECRADESRVVLRCSQRRYHLVRALNQCPALGETLHGSTPHLGFGILLSPRSGAVFRVIFESLGHTDSPLGPAAGRQPALRSPDRVQPGF